MTIPPQIYMEAMFIFAW